jgi:hypothetical protein
VHRRCREGKSREALQGVGNLRTLELRSTPLFDSRSGWSLKQDLLPANFWTKCPEKPAKGHSHHEHDDPPESRLPRLAWPRQCCLHRPKTNSIVWWRIWRSSGDIELMLSALRFNPFLQGPLRLHELLHIRTATSRVRIQWCPSVRTVAAACALLLLSLQSEKCLPVRPRPRRAFNMLEDRSWTTRWLRFHFTEEFLDIFSRNCLCESAGGC